MKTKPELAPTSWLTAAALCPFAQAAPSLPQAVTYVPAGTSTKLGANHPVPDASDKSSRPAASTPSRQNGMVPGAESKPPREQTVVQPQLRPPGGSLRRYSPPPTFSPGSGEQRVPARPAGPSTASSGRWLGPGYPPWCRIAELRSVAGGWIGAQSPGLHPGRAIASSPGKLER